jgi:hypothetical protein
MWLRSRRQPVHASNVNDECEDQPATKEMERVG